MSWSITAVGKVGPALREKVADEFSRQKNHIDIPHERRSLELAQGLIENELEALVSESADPVAVTIAASGHASARDGEVVQTSIRVSVEPLYGFVSD